MGIGRRGRGGDGGGGQANTEDSARAVRADQDDVLSICLCLILKGFFMEFSIEDRTGIEERNICKENGGYFVHGGSGAEQNKTGPVFSPRTR